MTGVLEPLLARYRQRGLLIDTNILLLWVVGTLNPQRINSFKRTKQYFDPEDFDRLNQLTNYFTTIVTTPSILTEVSSFVNQLSDRERAQGLAILARGIENVLSEHYQPSRELAQLAAFPRFGLTDCGIVAVARGQYLVLTNDFKLYQYLAHLNIDVVNFNHLKFSMPNH